MKICSKCKQEKSLDGFTKDKSVKKDGLHPSCKSCKKEYRDSNKEKIKNYQLEWYEKNIDKVRSYNKKYKDANAENIIAFRVKRLYNLSLDEYRKMLSRGCQVCSSFNNLCIDHDHSCCSGETTCGKCIRGVLCNKCNSAEGLLDSDPARVLKLYEYMNASLRQEK